MNNQTSALRIDHFDRINTDLEPFSSRNTVQALDWSNTNVELFKPRYLAYGPITFNICRYAILWISTTYTN